MQLTEDDNRKTQHENKSAQIQEIKGFKVEQLQQNVTKKEVSGSTPNDFQVQFDRRNRTSQLPFVRNDRKRFCSVGKILLLKLKNTSN